MFYVFGPNVERRTSHVARRTTISDGPSLSELLLHEADARPGAVSSGAGSLGEDREQAQQQRQPLATGRFLQRGPHGHGTPSMAGEEGRAFRRSELQRGARLLESGA